MERDDFVDWLTGDALRILGIVVAVVAINIALRRVTPALVRGFARLRSMSDRRMAEQRAETVARVLYVTGWVTSWVVGIVTILPLLGIEIAPLVATAGIGSLAIAFGAQTLVRDVLSGMFILIEDQYAIGDTVSLAGTTGVVQDISLRRTVLRDADGVVYYIPNSQVTTVENRTTMHSSVELELSLPPDIDVERASSIILATGHALASDPARAPGLVSPPRVLRIERLTDAALTLRIGAETVRGAQWQIGGELLQRLRQAFANEGIAMSGQVTATGAHGDGAPVFSGAPAAEDGS